MNGKAESEFKVSARRMLEMATIEGARSMGIDDKIGSLKPGKRADLMMVSTRAANLGVFGDPAVMLVTAAQPANVDTVVVDGRILKRGGKLTHLNVDQIAKEAGDASAALRKRANWNSEAASMRGNLAPSPRGGFLPGWSAPHFLQVRAFSSAKNAS